MPSNILINKEKKYCTKNSQITAFSVFSRYLGSFYQHIPIVIHRFCGQIALSQRIKGIQRIV